MMSGNKKQRAANIDMFGLDPRSYESRFDDPRLPSQLWRVLELMRDGRWRTRREIEQETGEPPDSVGARLRDLRKAQFGSFTVERRWRIGRWGEESEYRVMCTPPEAG